MTKPAIPIDVVISRLEDRVDWLRSRLITHETEFEDTWMSKAHINEFVSDIERLLPYLDKLKSLTSDDTEEYERVLHKLREVGVLILS